MIHCPKVGLLFHEAAPVGVARGCLRANMPGFFSRVWVPVAVVVSAAAGVFRLLKKPMVERWWLCQWRVGKVFG